MSLTWRQQKIFTPNHFERYLGFRLTGDLLHDEIIPKKLRNSLASVDYEPTSVNKLQQNSVGESFLTFTGNESGDSLGIAEKGEDPWELVRDCPNDCSHIQCPFRAQDDSNIFIATHSQITASKTSLLRVVSSMSLFDSTAFERSSFLNITRVIPVRNHSVIIHWKIKSVYGVRGFMVYLDGHLASKIFSSGRTAALIKDVDMEVPHNFSVAVIRNDDENFFMNISRKASQMIEPAVYIYKP